MEQQQEPEGICKLVQPQQVHEDDTGETDVGSASDPEYCTVDDLSPVVCTEDTGSHGDPADDQAGVVEIETVDPLSVGEPPEKETSDCVGDPDDGQEESRPALLYT